MESVGNFLHCQFGRLEQYFDFENGKVVNDLFSGITSDSFADTSHIFGRNAQFVGIEADFPLRSTMLVHKRYETFEDFILSGTTFYFMLAEIAVTLIVTSINDWR